MMMRPRIIPSLLVSGTGLVKGQKFKDYKYLGDPINIVKIFNEKEVDEIFLLDVKTTVEKSEPRYEFLQDIASEAFFPLGYGGGLRSCEQIRKILSSGFEKVSINTGAIENPQLIKEAAETFGSSTIVVSIDAKKALLGGHTVYSHSGQKKTKLKPVDWAKKVEELGAGEILINSIDQDGSMNGYDLGLIEQVASEVSIPVVAAGGAGTLRHMVEAVQKSKASAAAAGSFFVFQGPHRAVLVSYPTDQEIRDHF
jgi:cyclase